MSNPINYVKCIDPLSKRSYYYNCITHDAQWNCPKGLKEKVDDVSLPKDDNTICNYYARVVKSYSKMGNNEVSLAENDVVHVLRSFKNGWGAGHTSLSESGFFPLSHTKPIIPSSDFPSATPILRHSEESVRSFIRDTTRSKSSLHQSTRVSSDLTRTNTLNFHNQRRIHSVLSGKNNEEMLHYFYQILIESVLQDSVRKEDIANIEALRQKYGIPLADHLSILSNIDDGLTQYTNYLEEFGIMDPREIKMIYYSEINPTNSSHSDVNVSESSHTLSYEEYNRINKQNVNRPFLQILSLDGIYKQTEERGVIVSDYHISHFAHMYVVSETTGKHADTDSFNFSPKVPTGALLSIPPELVPQSIEAKKIVMMYMRDLPITGNPSNMLTDLEEYLMNPFLCDEVFFFLIKQTTANMQQASETRGWELFNYVLTVKKPSRSFYSYVLYYIIQGVFNNETQLLGLKLNALLLMLGQVHQFQLSRVQLERVNKQIFQFCSFDCSLEELLRLESTMELLHHYNLLLPSQQPFGSSSSTLSKDCYDVDCDSKAVSLILLQGARFLHRTFNTRSQKSRLLAIAPTFDRILFCKHNREIEQIFSLSEMVNVDFSETDKKNPLIVISFTQKRTVVLRVGSSLEQTRWYLYLKVLFSWYKVTGYTLIASMKAGLNEEDLIQYQGCLVVGTEKNLSLPVQRLIQITRSSFEAFIKEKTASQAPYPHSIDMTYHSPIHTVPKILVSIVNNLIRLKAFLILDPLKNLPPVNQSLKESVFYGDYGALDSVDDPLTLFALLKDWLSSLNGGLLPEDRYDEAMELAKEDKEEEVYQFVMKLPSAYRDTLLFFFRFVWMLSLFKKSVTFDSSNYSFAQQYAFVIKGKMFHEEAYTVTLISKFIACILRAIGVHPREDFLPEDQCELAMADYSVLLHSHIPPSVEHIGGYEYTLDNLVTLEKTADIMFSFGILPEKNTFGCSSYKLPSIPSEPITLFYKSSEYLVKTAETVVYSLGNIWLNPSLSRVLYSVHGKTYYIPWDSIQRISGSPPVVLSEKTKRSIQGRCLSVISSIATTIDIIFYSSERRNCMFNILDLLFEWHREEEPRIRKRFALKEQEEVLLVKCRDYEDVQKYCPSLLPFVDALHSSFVQYIKERDDRLTMVSFDRLKQMEDLKEQDKQRDNPYVLKLFVEISQALATMKAHLEEGVFRQPGSRLLGHEYKKQVRLGNYDIVKTIQGYKEMTSLLTSSLGFKQERLIPSSFLPSILEVNTTRSPSKAYDLLCKMPMVNHYTLLYLCHMWYELSRYSNVNKMTIDNICTCVCPALIYVNDNTEFLRIVSPLFTYIKLLIMATSDVDLEKENIRFSFE